MNRETLLAEAKEFEKAASAVNSVIVLNSARLSPLGKKMLQDKHNLLKKKALALKSQALAILPIQIEGFLGEDEDEVDCDERGRVMEIGWWLGCPNLNQEKYFSPHLQYSIENDISEILKLNTGKYLRITIEAVDIDNREKCNKCADRFNCFTTEWKF